MNSPMLTRTDQEEHEKRDLAPYAVWSVTSKGRDHEEPEHQYRTCFQRDRDRIIHSNAFRRLEYKTQVFVNHEGDYYRTRLTHTMETTQIARNIARALQLNEDLTEAVALAHDLGHPPFGHSGQDVLAACMKKHNERFEHNNQGLRVVELLEQHYPNFRGINLTVEVREGMAKHNSRWALPMDSFIPPRGVHLEGQVADYSDSIAYDNHDVDDGLKSGILSDKAVMEVPLWQEAFEGAKAKFGTASDQIWRYQAIINLINMEVTDLIQTTLENLQARQVETLDEVWAQDVPLVGFSKDMAAKKKELQKFLHQHMYGHYRVVRMSTRAAYYLEHLFKAFVDTPKTLPPDFQDWCDQVGTARGICDYLAGMTDRYAQQEFQKFTMPFERV